MKNQKTNWIAIVCAIVMLVLAAMLLHSIMTTPIYIMGIESFILSLVLLSLVIWAFTLIMKSI